MITGLSLCSGIGGIDLGLDASIEQYRTICYVESDKYCQDVLTRRMEDGALDAAPIWANVRTFNTGPWQGLVDIIHAGYPCQPFSIAGDRKAEKDVRHVWPSIRHIITEVEPSLVFLENVANHYGLGFQEVYEDLEGLGYSVAAGLFTAAEYGAPHIRRRLFCLAYADNGRSFDEIQARRKTIRPHRQAVADTSTQRLEGGQLTQALHRDGQGQEAHGSVAQLCSAWPPAPSQADGWPEGLEPSIRRVAHGIPNRLDRLKTLGNAVVPAMAANAFWQLMDALEEA